MKTYVKSKGGTIILLVIEVALFALGVWSMLQDINFLASKRLSAAKIVKIEKLQLPSPYKITLTYLNDYLHKEITTYIDNVDGEFGEKLPPVGGEINIYYKRDLPKVIYIVDYKHPTIGYIVLYLIFLLIISTAIIMQLLKLKKAVRLNL